MCNTGATAIALFIGSAANCSENVSPRKHNIYKLLLAVLRTVMNIKRIVNHEDKHNLDITAKMNQDEFIELHGCLNRLCVVNASAIKTPCSVIKTGARHSCAKYFLFPAPLRRRFKTDEFDYNEIRCGTMECDNVLLVVYRIPRRGIGVDTGSPIRR